MDNTNKKGSLKEQVIVIDLEKGKMLQEGKLSESWLAQFGAMTKIVLGRIFGLNKTPITIKGKKTDVDAFVSVLGGEKRYIEALHKYGLEDPQALKAKGTLQSAIRSFESETGIKYPFSI